MPLCPYPTTTVHDCQPEHESLSVCHSCGSPVIACPECRSAGAVGNSWNRINDKFCRNCGRAISLDTILEHEGWNDLTRLLREGVQSKLPLPETGSRVTTDGPDFRITAADSGHWFLHAYDKGRNSTRLWSIRAGCKEPKLQSHASSFSGQLVSAVKIGEDHILLVCENAFAVYRFDLDEIVAMEMQDYHEIPASNGKLHHELAGPWSNDAGSHLLCGLLRDESDTLTRVTIVIDASGRSDRILDVKVSATPALKRIADFAGPFRIEEKAWLLYRSGKSIQLLGMEPHDLESNQKLPVPEGSNPSLGILSVIQDPRKPQLVAIRTDRGLESFIPGSTHRILAGGNLRENEFSSGILSAAPEGFVCIQNGGKDLRCLQLTTGREALIRNLQCFHRPSQGEILGKSMLVITGQGNGGQLTAIRLDQHAIQDPDIHSIPMYTNGGGMQFSVTAGCVAWIDKGTGAGDPASLVVCNPPFWGARR
jgi:ferredoxin